MCYHHTAVSTVIVTLLVRIHEELSDKSTSSQGEYLRWSLNPELEPPQHLAITQTGSWPDELKPVCQDACTVCTGAPFTAKVGSPQVSINRGKNPRQAQP